MTKRKFLALGAMALSAVALAAPAAAQAELELYTDGSPAPAGTILHGHGELSTTVGPFRSGPCEVTIEGETFSTTTMEVIYEAFAPCETVIPGCEMTEVTNTRPWTVHLETPDVVNITHVTWANVYNDGCTGIGLPPGVPIPAAGNLTGTATTNGCIDFNSAGDMKREGSEVGATVDGEICLTDAEDPSHPITFEPLP